MSDSNDSNWEEWGADISYVILTLEYLGLILITGYCFRSVKDKQARSKWQLWFIVIFFISCLGLFFFSFYSIHKLTN